MKFHSKQHIIDLAALSFKKGVSLVVISPGSRNAPLIKSFFSIFKDKCISIPDERVAGYVALGMAQQTNSPVVLICTSGTAALNYGPALAEAYYQHIPLVAITADRPRAWINQQDNQSIKQDNLFINFIKRSFQFPGTIKNEEDLWFANRLANEAFNVCMEPLEGPVHLNVPLSDPLYEPLPNPSKGLKTINKIDPCNEFVLPREYREEWNNAEGILIIHGASAPGEMLNTALQELSLDKRVVVLAENIANLNVPLSISRIDFLLSNMEKNELPKPNLVIYSGGQVVSKYLKTYLREIHDVIGWRIGNDENIIDTYQLTTRIIKVSPYQFYQSLLLLPLNTGKKNYQNDWNHATGKIFPKLNKVLEETSFSDIHALKIILENLDRDYIVQLGNSGTIRYSQFFEKDELFTYYSNRGVSGIDGCLSTAVGAAMASDKETLVILGDISFIYDSNGLWNNKLPSKLKIVVLNNRGGGIFHLLDGPSGEESFVPFIEAYHRVDIKALCKAFNIGYFSASNEKELKLLLPSFTESKGSAVLLEVSTSSSNNKTVYNRLLNK